MSDAINPKSPIPNPNRSQKAELSGAKSEDWYSSWFDTPYYHILYKDRNYREAQLFMDNLTHYLNLPEKAKVLDLACGKGRHSIYLNQLGFKVLGVDLSENSIEFAKQFENENLEFFIHDMRLPFHVNYFDYALNFFTSFGYFNTRREHDDAIRTITNSLRPGGLFVIDYLNVHYAEDHLVHNEVKKIGDSVYDIHRWDDETHYYKKINSI